MSEVGQGEWRAHWPTVVSSMVGVSLATLYTYSAGAFIGPLERELGWSRTEITFGLTIATTCAAIVGPFVGAAIDRLGPRRLALPGIVLFAASVALLSQASTPRLWWLQWAVVGIASAGVKPTIWVSAISSLFVRHRGLALALTLSGAGLGSVLVPIVSTGLIAAAGWRMAYVWLALCWGGVALALAVPFFRGSRDHRRRASRPAARSTEPEGTALRQSVLSWRYLLILCASLLCALVQMAILVSLIPMLTGWGFAAKPAAALAASVGATSIVARLVSGALLDRVEPRLVSAVSVAALAGTAALLLAAPASTVVVTLAALLLGLSIGAELEAATFLTARYFGMRHFGLLFGVILSGITVATGVGPLLASVIFDRTGSYEGLLWPAIPLSLVAATMLLALGSRQPADMA